MYIDKIKQFMRLMGQDTPVNPNVVDEKLNNLRVGLIQEELDELRDALETCVSKHNSFNDIVSSTDIAEVLDALVDLQYVLSGAVISFGLDRIFNDAFNLVHDANMSKVCKSTDEAEKTIEKYKAEGIECYSEPITGFIDWHVVKRSSDNKVLKSIKFKHPDLIEIVKKI